MPQNKPYFLNLCKYFFTSNVQTLASMRATDARKFETEKLVVQRSRNLHTSRNSFRVNLSKRQKRRDAFDWLWLVAMRWNGCNVTTTNQSEPARLAYREESRRDRSVNATHASHAHAQGGGGACVSACVFYIFIRGVMVEIIKRVIFASLTVYIGGCMSIEWMKWEIYVWGY